MRGASIYNKKRQTVFHIIIISLLILWIPVSIDKIMGFSAFKQGILRQPFSDNLGYLLVYILPILEVLTVLALVIDRYRKIGLILSTVLMLAFTGYIGVALLGAWEKLPCGCGSVISGMSWKQHFFFNLFFLMTSIVGYFLHRSLHRNIDLGQTYVEGFSSAK